MDEPTRKKAGRPRKSPEGKRVVMHLTFSPAAVRSLRALCAHPVQSFSYSAMLEFLIAEAAKKKKLPRDAEEPTPLPPDEADDDQATGSPDGA